MINIYRIINVTEQVSCSLANDNATVVNEIMGREEVNIDVVVDTPHDIQVGDYVRVDGIIYALNREPSFEKVSDVEYKYDLVFESPLYRLMDKLFVNPITSVSNYSVSRTLEEFVKMVVDCINTIDSGWSYASDIPQTKPKLLTFNAMYCRDVLTSLARFFDVEFYLVGKAIHFVNRIGNQTGLIFEQGKGKGLYTISQELVGNENTVTRVLPYGSNRNVVPGKGDAYGRVCLPEKHLENFSEYSKIVEKEVEFPEVFPHFEGSVDLVSGEFNKVLKCNGINFNIEDYAIGGTPVKINFLSGDLMGESFEFQWNNTRKEIMLILKEDENALPNTKGKKPTIPNALKKVQITDTFNFTDLNMPAEYYDSAVVELREKATEWLNYHSRSRVKYALEVDYRYLRGKGQLKAGDLLTIKIPETGIEKLLRVTLIERNLKTGKVNCTVSSYLDEKWEKKIEVQIRKASEASSTIESGLNAHINNQDMHLVEGDRDVLRLLSVDSEGRLKVSADFYSEKSVSARGPSQSLEPGTLTSIGDLVDVDDTGKISGSILMFNGTHWVVEDGSNISPDLTGYATENWVNEQGYLKSQALADYATKTYVDNSVSSKWTQDNNKIANWNTAFGWGNHASAGYITAAELATYFKKDSQGRIYTDLDFYSTKSVSARGASGSSGSGTLTSLGDLVDVNDTGKAPGKILTFNGTHWVCGEASGGATDLTGYATENWVDTQGFLKAVHLTGYAKESWVNTQGFLKASNLTGYATQTWVNSQGFLKQNDVNSKVDWNGNINASAFPDHQIGYGFANTGWYTSGPAMAFGSGAYTCQIQQAIGTTGLLFRTVYNNAPSNWYTIYNSGNSNLSTVDWVTKNLTAVGNIHATNGYLMSTSQGCTLTIGSMNPPYVHFIVDPARYFYFNNAVEVAGTVHPYINNTYSTGLPTNRWSNVYSVGGDFAGNVNVGGNVTSVSGFRTNGVSLNYTTLNILTEGIIRVGHIEVNTGYCTPMLTWSSQTEAGYISRMGIGSWRQYANDWGRMYFAIGTNDAATSSVNHYMDRNGIHATGYLTSTLADCTLTIGALNTTYVYFSASPARTFYFSNTVDVNGSIYPHVGNTHYCGTSGYRWINVYSTYGDFSGSVNVANSLIFGGGNYIMSDRSAYVGFLTSGNAACPIAVGGITVSDHYGDVSKRPAYGVYSKGEILSASNIKATGSVTARTASDIRLKENFRSIDNALGIINKLTPFYYTWIQEAFALDSGLRQGYDIGLSAQQVKEYFQVASISMWNDYLGIDYAKITPLIIAGMQEFSSWKDKKDIEIERLKKRVETLENQLKAA